MFRKVGGANRSKAEISSSVDPNWRQRCSSGETRPKGGTEKRRTDAYLGKLSKSGKAPTPRRTVKYLDQKKNLKVKRKKIEIYSRLCVTGIVKKLQ